MGFVASPCRVGAQRILEGVLCFPTPLMLVDDKARYAFFGRNWRCGCVANGRHLRLGSILLALSQAQLGLEPGRVEAMSGTSVVKSSLSVWRLQERARVDVIRAARDFYNDSGRQASVRPTRGFFSVGPRAGNSSLLNDVRWREPYVLSEGGGEKPRRWVDPKKKLRQANADLLFSGNTRSLGKEEYGKRINFPQL